MAKKQDNSLYNTHVIEPSSKLHTDSSPVNQPKNTHRFALNAVNETKDGKHGFISNEKGFAAVTNFPDNFSPIGDRYTQDDTVAVILTNPTNGRDQIGIVQKNDQYSTIVDTGVLGLRITDQCEIIYRLRRGNEGVIYWVDAFHKARTFSLTKPYNFYNQAFRDYLKAGGIPDAYGGEKWDAASFDLIKSYSRIPFFSDVSIVESGSIAPGSYNFAIQLVDQDLNPTNWITTSNTVNIFNDSTDNAYETIRGSRNVTSDAQTFPRANKSIKLVITNLDTSFSYYRVAIIRAAGNNGQPEKVFASDLYPTSESNFLYTGNDGNLIETKLSDILVDSEVIFAPKHIEQLENRLLLHNTRGKGINWCDFQKYASRISSDLVTKEVLLNNALSEPNVKNAKSTFLYRGYMPGEAYSFGIAYLFNDGTISPTLHIPGKSLVNTTSLMKAYEISNRYLNIHDCANSNYWGVDSEGDTLLGKRIRPHRFPFRKEVNKPLFTRNASTSNLTRYRLKANVILNPAWTPGPIAFPDDGGTPPLPLVISYTFNYQVLGAPTPTGFNGLLTDTDLGVDIFIYDDSTDLDNGTILAYGELDTGSQLATYQDLGGGGANARFIITFTRETYILDSSINNDVSEIFGIKFSNIEKPHPDIVGFYIVRNERTDDDRLILDNAILGPMTQFQQYKSFGQWTPKQFFTTNNCGIAPPADSGKTLSFYDKGMWFFNPEFQFFNKKTEFTTIEVEGVYSESAVTYPTISNVANQECNTEGSKGVYVNDVQAGTSYNPEINKRKDRDDDGFDLLIGYKNTDFTYLSNDVLVFPLKKRVVYLNAAAYQNIETDTFYNVSVDNKIGMYLVDAADTIPTNTFFNAGTGRNSLVYAALTRDTQSAYSNFITRPYYKEHNNPIMFGNATILNNVSIYNGDAQISALNMVSSVFYDMVVADRAKKSGLWKIIVGAILIVVGVVVGIFSAGAGLGISAVGAALLAGLAISYGVSLAMSGIKFEQFKNMVETDYEKGLKETVVDGGIFETIRDTIEREDDTIRWFADRVSNIYIESSVPFGLRTGLTCGVPDFTNAPAPYNEASFRSYLIEKLTIVDRDQGSGRLYKGYTTAEFYDMNLDYMRFNKEKIFIHLPLEYDCCANGEDERFPLRTWYSEQSFQEEKTDNYRIFLPNNYRDIEGEHGEITDSYRLGNNLYIHTREALWQLPQNLQERVTSEIVSFIGTGEFFNIPPRKIVDDTLGSAGSQHKWATIKTKNGVMFVNEIENKVYLHADSIKDISVGDNGNWFENNLKPNLALQIFDKFSISFAHDNNPANPEGVGYLSTYDTRYNRILLTKIDYALLPNALTALQLVPTRPVSGTDFVYAEDDGLFYQGTIQVHLNNGDYFENKSWTLSYSFYTKEWISLHSYLPNYYIRSQNNLYSYIARQSSMWKHNIEGIYHTYYGIYYPYILELVKLANPLLTTTFEDLSLETEARIYDPIGKEYIDARFITFNKITISNTRQTTGELEMLVKDTQANPQNWYAQQLVNAANTILITRRERDWNINEFRDYVDRYDKSLFSSDWALIRGQYPIDKVINGDVVNYNKSWHELEIFRDKYIIIRLKFDNFSNVNLTMNYTLETEQPSLP